MKIWIFNHYASTPDQPMTGAYYLARALAERGHAVRFFASSFSYYKRKELRLSGLQLTGEDEAEGIHFNWIRTVPHGLRMLPRFINMLSYMFVSVVIGLRHKEKPDIVIGSCPHLFGAISAMLVARLRGSSFVYEVRDLWPQTFVDCGTLKKNSLLTRTLQRVELMLYRRARLIVSVLPFVNEYLAKLNIDTAKWTWVPNGIDAAAYPRLEPPKRDAEGNLTFMYLGGHARYQGLDTILQAAHLLQKQGIEDARFVLVGDGVVKPELEASAARLQLRNVEFRDAVPRSEVPDQLAQAGVAIFHILPLPVLRFGASPNKLCDYMASGRPVLCAGNLRNNPVADANAGICVPSEDALAMANAVQEFLAMSPNELRAAGSRARRYAMENWDSHVLAERLEGELYRVLDPSRETTPIRRAA